MNLLLVVSCLCALIFANAQDDWNKRYPYSNVQFSNQHQNTNYQNFINAEYQKYYDNYVRRNSEYFTKLFPNLIAASVPAPALSTVMQDNSAQTLSSSSNSNEETSYSFKTTSAGSSQKSNANVVGGSPIYPYYIPYGSNVFSYPGLNGNGQYQGNSANLPAGVQVYANSASANLAAGVQDYANSAASIAAYVAGIQNQDKNSVVASLANRNQAGGSAFVTTNEKDENAHANQFLQPPEKESFNTIHGNPVLTTSLPLAATGDSVNLDQNKPPVTSATASTSVNSGSFIGTNQINLTGASAVTSNGIANPVSVNSGGFTGTNQINLAGASAVTSNGIANPVFTTGSIHQTPSYLEVAPFVSSIREDIKPVHSAFATASASAAQFSSDIAPFVSTIFQYNNPAASASAAASFSTPLGQSGNIGSAGSSQFVAASSSPLDQNGNIGSSAAASSSSSLNQNGNIGSSGSSQFIAASSSSPLNQNENVGSSGSSQLTSENTPSVDVSATADARANQTNDLSSTQVNIFTETPSTTPTEINLSSGTLLNLENKNKVEDTTNVQASVSSSSSTTNNFDLTGKTENGVFLLALPGDSNVVQNGNGYKLLQVAIPIDVLKKLLAENDEETLNKMMVSIESKISTAVADANADALRVLFEKNSATAEANAAASAGISTVTEKAAHEILINTKNFMNTLANAEANVAISTTTTFATPSPNPTSTTFENTEVIVTTSPTFKNSKATSITEAPITQKATSETTQLTKSSTVDATLAKAENVDKNPFVVNPYNLIPVEGNSGVFVEFLPNFYFSNGNEQEITIASRFGDEDELPFRYNSKQVAGQYTLDSLLNPVFKIKQSSSSLPIKNVKSGSASAFIVNGRDKSVPMILFKYPSREVQAASAAYSSSSGKKEFKYVSNGAQRSYKKNKYYSLNKHQHGSYP